MEAVCWNLCKVICVLKVAGGGVANLRAGHTGGLLAVKKAILKKISKKQRRAPAGKKGNVSRTRDVKLDFLRVEFPIKHYIK